MQTRASDQRVIRTFQNESVNINDMGKYSKMRAVDYRENRI